MYIVLVTVLVHGIILQEISANECCTVVDIGNYACISCDTDMEKIIAMCYEDEQLIKQVLKNYAHAVMSEIDALDRTDRAEEMVRVFADRIAELEAEIHALKCDSSVREFFVAVR